MITKQQFYNLYNRNSAKNKKRHIGDITNKYFRRNFSLHIAYFLAKRDTSPNSVTLTFFFLGLIANLLFIIPSFYTAVSLLVIYEIVRILDNVDGQLARFYGTSSVYGELLDIYTEMVIYSSFIAAFGMRLYIQTDHIIFLILGIFGVIAYVTESLWVKSSDIIFSSMQTNKINVIQKIRTIYLNIDNMTVITVAILILSVIHILANTLILITWFFSSYVIFIFIIKIVVRLYLTYHKAQAVSKGNWKGW